MKVSVTWANHAILITKVKKEKKEEKKRDHKRWRILHKIIFSNVIVSLLLS